MDPSRRDFLKVAAGTVGAGVLAGAGLQAGTRAVAAAAGPETPYAQTVDIPIGWTDNKAGGAAIPPGQTQILNDATTWVQKSLNVNLVWDFIAPTANNAYDTKVSLVLASGSMPDVMVTNLQQFHRLANAGMLED